MAEKKCKVGVVGGAGTWGRHYLRAFAEREDCEVILVDRAGERARQFADHHGVEKVLESLDDLLAGPVPDVVSAILPVSQTYGAVMACAEAGVKASWRIGRCGFIRMSTGCRGGMWRGGRVLGMRGRRKFGGGRR